LEITPAKEFLPVIERGGTPGKKKLKKRKSVVILKLDIIKKKELCLNEGF